MLEAAQVASAGREEVTVVLLQCMWEDGTAWGSVLSYGTNLPKPKLLQVVLGY